MEKVPYVRLVKAPSGQIYPYFRKKGEAYKQRLNSSPDDVVGLKAEVDAILARLAAADAAKTAKPGTLGGMLEAYRNDAGRFKIKLAESTQDEYSRMIDELIEDFGDLTLRSITAPAVADMMSLWAERGYKAANDRRQILKNALEPALLDDRVPGDLFIKVEKLDRPNDMGEAHPYWEDAEIEAAISWAEDRKLWGLARAIALGRYGGFRRGTICAIPLNARSVAHDENDEAYQRLYYMTEKRQVLCDKPEDPRLTAVLARTPNKALTIAYNDRDQSWKVRALNQAVTRMVEALNKEGKCRLGLTPHGWRHARGVELALAGASDAEIMAQLEHATDAAARIYRRQANRRRLAHAAQARIDNVVQLKKARAKSAEKNSTI